MVPPLEDHPARGWWKLLTSIHASSSQGPERWETETDAEEGAGMDQVDQVVPDLKVEYFFMDVPSGRGAPTK